jgi:hypothetical protein
MSLWTRCAVAAAEQLHLFTVMKTCIRRRRILSLIHRQVQDDAGVPLKRRPFDMIHERFLFLIVFPQNDAPERLGLDRPLILKHFETELNPGNQGKSYYIPMFFKLYPTFWTPTAPTKKHKKNSSFAASPSCDRGGCTMGHECHADLSEGGEIL